MTISVGFRAPTIHEIMNGLISKALADGDETLRYSDPDLRSQMPGEIGPDAIKRIQKAIEKQMLSESFIADWLGQHVTEPYCDVELQRSKKAPTAAQLKALLAQANTVTRAEGARFAYVRGTENSITLYANGQRLELSGKSAQLGQTLADKIVNSAKEIVRFCSDTKAGNLLGQLVGDGALIID
jgi:50S ribosomal protein L16 3-hydroxylase